VKFNELLERLPRIALTPDVVYPQRALSTSPTAPTGYVEPSFEVIEWPQDAAVVLIEAAGAVGKSVAAEALAAELHWPLMRAEQAHVGSYSLSGLIQDAFGFGSDYISQIATGQAGVVVDSLDEAHLRAGTQNFLAFLENVRNISGWTPDQASNARQPSILLLSRSDTAELVRLYFADQDLPLASIRLSFFDRMGADRFINCYLRARFEVTRKPEYNIALAAPAPFAHLRDQRYQQVMQVLLRTSDVDVTRDWTAASEFLGYAPVLIALSESLAVTNPAAERSALAAAKSNNENDLLSDIVTRILEREREKVKTNLAAKLEASLPASSDAAFDPDDLYTASEQITRLASTILGIPVASALPASLPGAVRDLYEQSVKGFLADHPFIKGRAFASPVFGDYTLSFAVGDLAARASLAQDPVRASLDVGPFFLAFYRRLTRELPDMTVPEDLVGSLLDSWSQETELRGDRAGQALVELSADGGHLFFANIQGTVDEESIMLPVDGVTGALHLHRVHNDVSIVTDGGIILGERNQQLHLGHHVFIVATEIVIEAEALSVTRGRETDYIALAADSLVANYLTQVDASPRTLKIFAADPPPRLMGFKTELRGTSGPVPFSHYTGLRSILTAFRANVHLGLSVKKDHLERIIDKHESVRAPILRSLMDRGVIYEYGDWFRLETKALDSVGFSLGAIKDGTPSETVLKFLSECISGKP